MPRSNNSTEETSMAAQISASVVATAEDLWSKLPADLLGAVYDKVASPLSRVRFTAVCRLWRAVASGQQPMMPTSPWLILYSYGDMAAKCLFCPVDGAILHVPLLHEVIGKRLIGFHDGGWIAAATMASNNVNADSSLVIVNVFSGIEVPLSAKQRTTPTIWKVVFSEAPSSKLCILAAIFNGALAVCRVGCPKHEWWMPKKYGGLFHDIEFCNGKLYGLVRNCKLFIFDIRMTKKGRPVLSLSYELGPDQLPKHTSWERSKHDANWYNHSNFSYIVKHESKLLMALRIQGPGDYDYFFQVFELVNTDKWEEVTALHEHALFLSGTCSKIVHVPFGRHGGIKRNHIYYNHIYSTIDISTRDVVHLRRCDNDNHLFCREVQNLNVVDGIMSVRYHMTGHYKALGWLLPPDF